MTRWSAALTALVLAAGVSLSAQAAPGQARGAAPAPPPPPSNLQVLPKDWTRQQVVQVMQVFNAALGVQCAHCHVFAGPNDPANDFASDAKPQKTVARQMMLMVRAINPMIETAVAPKAADQVSQVNCAMCHRGTAVPSIPAPGAPGVGGAAPAGRGN